MTKHNHIDTLSEELLLHIFRDLRSSSTAGALLPSLLLCRRFNRIGTPLLYQDVVIRNPSLRVSIASLITHGHEVRSLSIRIRPCEIEMYTPAGQQDYIRVPVGDPHKLASEGSGPTQALWKALDAFSSAVIPRLRHLFTFSLTLEHTLGEGLPPGFWIHPRSLLPILRNLPLSVENLEVDLAFSEHPFIHDNPTIHICPVLRPLLPQLRHLRLRLECLCPALFYDVGANEAVKAPQLETLGINTSVATRYTVPCGMPRLDTGVGYGLNIADCPNNPSYYWPALCLTVLEGGSFPRVQRFDVFNFEM